MRIRRIHNYIYADKGNRLLVGGYIGIAIFYTSEAIILNISIDEAASLTSSSNNLSALIDRSITEYDIVHMLYYALIHVVLLAFDNSLLAVRLVSVIATLISIHIVFRIGQRLLSRQVGLIASVAFAIMPVSLDYATQARSPALVTLFVAFLVLVVTNHSSSFKNKYLPISGLMTVIIFLNVLTSIIVACLLLFLFFEDKKRSKTYTVLAAIPPLVLGFPLIYVAASQSAQISWISENYNSTDSFARIFLWPFIESERKLPLFVILISISLVFLFLSTIKNGRLIATKKPPLPLIVAFAPPITLFIISFFHPIFQTRYFAYSSIGISVLVGIVFERRLRSKISRLLIAWLLCICMLQYWHLNSRGGNFDWENIENELKSGPMSYSILVSPSWQSDLVSFYGNDKHDVLALREIQADWPLNRHNKCVGIGQNIWVLSPYADLDERAPEVQELLLRGFTASAMNPGMQTKMKLFVSEKC